MRSLLVIIATAMYLGLSIAVEGGFAAFFSQPALVALAVVFLAAAIAAIFAGGGLSAGEREDRSNRWVLVPFALVGLALGFVPAYSDRIGFLTLDGNAIRWLGVLLCAAGSVLRIWPVFVLGNRFSGLVAIQPMHQLVTTGIYGFIRHPSYAGLLIGSAGWSLAFRSGAGLILTALLVPVVLSRIRSEEALLGRYFGPAYDAYRARTSRLLPGIF
ncbi:MAG TPA: isoprenylcysteine carboxylmethyltransferase family protein [Candidatus Cybelea sp.]